MPAARGIELGPPPPGTPIQLQKGCYAPLLFPFTMPARRHGVGPLVACYARSAFEVGPKDRRRIYFEFFAHLISLRSAFESLGEISDFIRIRFKKNK